MHLEYVESTRAYCLYVNRGEYDLNELTHTHGLNFSEPASTPQTAVMFTREMYAALAFRNHTRGRMPRAFVDASKQIELSRAIKSDGHVDCPDDKTPYSFQVAGVEYCMNRNGALIGDQPGVGKTAQAIMLANEMRAKRVLVICPANIRLQWAKNIREWTTMAGRPIIYPILKSADGVHPGAHWTILSYHLTSSEGIYEALLRGQYDLVVLDEAHYLKNNEAIRTKHFFGGRIAKAQEDDYFGETEYDVIRGLAAVCGYVLALTGTPLPNRPKEAYTLARGICWDAIDWASEQQFKDKYNPSEYNGQYAKEVKGRTPELNARLRTNIMIRRLKKEVLTQLPKVTHEITHLEETGAVRKALQAEAMLDIDPTDLTGLKAEVQGHISVVRKMMGIAMAPGVADYIDMLMQGGECKIFLAGWHKEVLDIWETKLHKWGVVRVDGRTTPARKQIAVDRFQDDPKIGIFIGNLMSAGIGTDGLQNVCCHGVLGECSWVPGDNEQIVSRLDRGGQTLPVLAEYMTVLGSFADRVLGSSLEKMQAIHESLDEEI